MKKLFLLLLAVTSTAITVRAQSAPPIVIELPLGNGCIKQPTAIVANEKENTVFTASSVSDFSGPAMPHDALVQKHDLFGNIISEYRYSEISYNVQPTSLILHNDNIIMVATLFSHFSQSDGITVVVLDSNLHSVTSGYYPFIPPAGRRIQVSSPCFVHDDLLNFIATSTSVSMNVDGTEWLDPQVLLLQFNMATGVLTQTELIAGKVCYGIAADENIIYAALKNNDTEHSVHILKFDIYDGNHIWMSNDVAVGNVQGFGFDNGVLKLSVSNAMFNVDQETGTLEFAEEFPFIPRVITQGFTAGSILNGPNAGDKIICSSVAEPDSGIVVADFTDANPSSMALIGDMYLGDKNIYFVGSFTNFATNPRTQTGFMGWFPKENVYVPDPVIEEPTDTTGGENTSTGISEIEGGTAVTVYPNPSDGNITVRVEKDDCKIVVTDIVGKVIFSQQLTTKETKIKLNCKSGIYFSQVTTAESKSTQTLIVY